MQYFYSYPNAHPRNEVVFFLFKGFIKFLLYSNNCYLIKTFGVRVLVGLSILFNANLSMNY